MKLLASIGLTTLLIIPAFVQAQPVASAKSDTASTTKLEAFLSKKGLLLIRDSSVPGRLVRYSEGAEWKIGMFKTYEEQHAVTSDNYNEYTEVTAVTVYEPAKEKIKAKGINIYVANLSSRVANSSTSTLDVEEAESLSKALDYMVDLSTKWNGQDVGNREVLFKTADNFEISLSQNTEGKRSILLSSGKINMVVMRFNNAEDFKKMKSLIDQSLNWLKTQ